MTRRFLGLWSYAGLTEEEAMDKDKEIVETIDARIEALKASDPLIHDGRDDHKLKPLASGSDGQVKPVDHA